MLHLITGTPGSGKTLYAVHLIDNYEIKNKRALEFNKSAFEHNKKTIADNSLYHYFDSYTYFSKILKDYETIFFDQDHFDYFLELDRKENIFLDIQHYNAICKNIKNDLNIDLKQLKHVRHIYANIDGLKVDFVREIKIDWRECPDGSIIFYDEIQLIDEYSNNNKRDEKKIIEHLTIHRHRAFDIYGITQFPRLVHPTFRDVVGLHYHLHRGWGAQAAKVYVWANCREKPNAIGNKFTAERDFRFSYPKRLYEVYESATANTVKFRIPYKFLMLLLIPLFGLMMLFNMFFSENNFFGTLMGKEKNQDAQHNEKVIASNDQAPASAVVASNDQAPASAVVESQNFNNDQTIAYDVSNPYQQHAVTYIATSKPVFAGCAKFANKYIAYTQQGTVIKDFNSSDCKRLLENGSDRPFNYFKNDQQNGLLTSSNSDISQVTTEKNQNQLSAEDLDKFQIAKERGLI